jgi:hypothetical protein
MAGFGMQLQPQSANDLEYRIEVGTAVTGERFVEAFA